MACPRAGQPAGYLNRAIRPAAPRGPASRGRHFLLATNSFAGLPVKPQSELDEPRSTVAADRPNRRGCSRNYFGRGRVRVGYRSERDVARRQVELRMVEEIEEVRAELYPAPFFNGEALHQGEVHVRLPGTFEQIARDVARLAAQRRREHRTVTYTGMAGECIARVSVVRGQARDAGSPIRPVGELVEPAVVEGRSRSREDRVGEA